MSILAIVCRPHPAHAAGRTGRPGGPQAGHHHRWRLPNDTQPARLRSARLYGDGVRHPAHSAIRDGGGAGIGSGAA